MKIAIIQVESFVLQLAVFSGIYFFSFCEYVLYKCDQFFRISFPIVFILFKNNELSKEIITTADAIDAIKI